MKHAGPGALARLGEVLASLRCRPSLREKRLGIFYVKGRAFLHFHEDPTGLFADLRQGREWLRLPLNSPEDREVLFDHLGQALDALGL